MCCYFLHYAPFSLGISIDVWGASYLIANIAGFFDLIKIELALM
jgi:hypothetical protein